MIFREAPWRLRVQEKSLVRVAVEVAYVDDFSVALILEDFSGNLKSLSTSPQS